MHARRVSHEVRIFSAHVYYLNHLLFTSSIKIFQSVILQQLYINCCHDVIISFLKSKVFTFAFAKESYNIIFSSKLCTACSNLLWFVFQSVKPRAQFSSNQEHLGCISTSIKEEEKEDNNNHQNRLRGERPPAPVNSLASATRIINHHLFGTISSSKHNTGNWLARYKVSRTRCLHDFSYYTVNYIYMYCVHIGEGNPGRNTFLLQNPYVPHSTKT